MATWRSKTICVAALLVALALGGCSGGDDADSAQAGKASSTQATTSSTVATEPGPEEADVVASLSDEVRRSTGGGEPRTSRYWIVWSTCGEGSQAETAIANGGRAKGWILVDDLLADPGVELGRVRLRTCEEAVSLLDGRTLRGASTTDLAYRLATETLTAELNLSAGAESCTAAEGAVRVARLLLSSMGFTGLGAYFPGEERKRGRTDEAIELLGAYNAGTLCR